MPWRTTRGAISAATALALLVAALMLAAGCGGDDDADDAAAPAAETTEATEAETPTYGKCEPTGEFDSVELVTVNSDTLTVGYTSIAPATYRGDTEESVDEGFNYCFAANIAHRAGLSKIDLKKVDFAQLIVAGESGFDVAIDDFYIKPEREEKIDFSIPYGGSWTGLVALSDNIPEESDLKDLKFGVTLGSVQQSWLDDVLKPTEQYNTYDEPVVMFAALRAKQIEAALIDMPVALPASEQSDGAMNTVAQIRAGGEVGIIMEPGTPNRDAIDGIVQELLDSGALKKLERKYYFDAYGGIDPDSLPEWGPSP